MNNATKREKGMSLGLSIEPQLQLARSGTTYSDIPQFNPWWTSFSVCIGVRPAYSFSDKFNIGLSFDNFFQRPYTVLMMQTYLGFGASLTFSRVVPIFLNADLGYSFWYYPGNEMFNSLWESSGPGYSLSLGYQFLKRFSIAAHFYNSFPQKPDENILIQNYTFGIRFTYKVRRPDQ